jgi:hypothetical protein
MKEKKVPPPSCSQSEVNPLLLKQKSTRKHPKSQNGHPKLAQTIQQTSKSKPRQNNNYRRTSGTINQI